MNILIKPPQALEEEFKKLSPEDQKMIGTQVLTIKNQKEEEVKQRARELAKQQAKDAEFANSKFFAGNVVESIIKGKGILADGRAVPYTESELKNLGITADDLDGTVGMAIDNASRTRNWSGIDAIIKHPLTGVALRNYFKSSLSSSVANTTAGDTEYKPIVQIALNMYDGLGDKASVAFGDNANDIRALYILDRTQGSEQARQIFAQAKVVLADNTRAEQIEKEVQNQHTTVTNVTDLIYGRNDIKVNLHGDENAELGRDVHDLAKILVASGISKGYEVAQDKLVGQHYAINGALVPYADLPLDKIQGLTEGQVTEGLKETYYNLLETELGGAQGVTTRYIKTIDGGQLVMTKIGTGRSVTWKVKDMANDIKYTLDHKDTNTYERVRPQRYVVGDPYAYTAGETPEEDYSDEDIMYP